MSEKKLIQIFLHAKILSGNRYFIEIYTPAKWRLGSRTGDPLGDGGKFILPSRGWGRTGIDTVAKIICGVLLIAKNITAAIFQYLCVIKIFFPTSGQPNTLWPETKWINQSEICSSTDPQSTEGQYLTIIPVINWRSVDEPISDHSCGRSEGSLVRHTHYNRMNSSLLQDFYLSPPPWKSCSYFSPLLSVETIQKCGTLGSSVFPLSHGFPLTSLKFYLADYNTVKET